MKLYLSVMASVLCFLSTQLFAQDYLDTAESVPLLFSQQKYNSLSQEKMQLDERKKAIEHDIVQFNAECSYVSMEDQKKIIYCRDLQGKIYDQIDVYDAALSRYHSKISQYSEKLFPNTKFTKYNYSTTGFWLEWLEEMRQDHRRLESSFREYHFNFHQTLDDLAKTKKELASAEKEKNKKLIKRAQKLIEYYDDKLNSLDKDTRKGLEQTGLRVIGTSSLHHEQYNNAIAFLTKAVQADPDNKELEKVLGLAYYKRDQLKAHQKPKEETIILLDALQYGQGSYKKSIDYVKEKMRNTKDEIKKEALLDVLIHIKSVEIYDQIKKEQSNKEFKKMFQDLLDEDFDERLRDRGR